MVQQKMPITYYGKVIGTATVEDSGEVHGEIDGSILSPEETKRILGPLPSLSIAVVEEDE